jgi:hypothetical protein
LLPTPCRRIIESLGLHPARGAVGPFFAFPEGGFGFQPVHEEFGRGEGVGAVGAGGEDEDEGGAGAQAPVAVDDGAVGAGPAGGGESAKPADDNVVDAEVKEVKKG